MIDLTPRRLLLLEHYADGEDARHFTLRIEQPQAADLAATPGQFFMLVLPGYGEAPFTYVSTPDEQGVFSALIRRMGALTTALFALENGAVLGYRGPFGTGWPLFFKAQRVLAVAGGCEIAISCDIRVASTNAWFGLSEVKVGVIAGVVTLIPLLRPGDDSYPDDPDRRDGFDEYFRGDWD